MPGHTPAGASITILPCFCTRGMAKAPPGHSDKNWDFFGFPLCSGGEGDAEQHQGTTAHPCYESKPGFLTEDDESLERDRPVEAMSFPCCGVGIEHKQHGQ